MEVVEVGDCASGAAGFGYLVECAGLKRGGNNCESQRDADGMFKCSQSPADKLLMGKCSLFRYFIQCYFFELGGCDLSDSTKKESACGCYRVTVLRMVYVF